MMPGFFAIFSGVILGILIRLLRPLSYPPLFKFIHKRATTTGGVLETDIWFTNMREYMRNGSAPSRPF